jgi:hypothetical protein
MHSPEMQKKIKSQFTSENFQDYIDKMEVWLSGRVTRYDPI